MNIAIGSRKSFLHYYGDDLYKKCKEFGFDAIDCRMLTDTTSEIYSLSEKEIIALHKKERALADKAGVELVQTHAPFGGQPRDVTREEREKHLTWMKRSLRCSSLLGVKLWVLHPLTPMGCSDLITGGVEETREINLDVFSKLLPVAKECGITICLENMPWPEFSISSPDEIHAMVDTVGDEHFKMCLDTGHNNIHSKGVSAGDQVRAHREVLRAIHVHDNNGIHDQHRFPYNGLVEWEDFGRALREIDFAGPFTYECAPSPRLPLYFFEAQLRMQRELADHILGNR
ncbi:MAG: sugar phosphate isomerase/epimerase [Clostridia bacterium]|nr:sugar phosphate isomerase/epimerase [Clostridia bacterium]